MSSVPTDRPTIYALASAPGRSGVAVVRVSGPDAADTVTAITGRPAPPARRAELRRFRDPATAETLDKGLVLWFPAPGSFTGEDVAEFHGHGGRAAVDGLLTVLGRLPGLRPAEPGEFSRRAFLNGRLDLTEAEAIADLADAETAAQRRQAVRQMEGALGALVESWRDRLIRAAAYLEAAIDFADEDLGENPAEQVVPAVRLLLDEIDIHLKDSRRAERLRDGVAVAIVGAPNAGKSSLLNRLARREAAIVAATAGTTRDVVEVHLDLGGYPVILADTAGLRDSDDPVEAEGIRRARTLASAADLRLAVFDAQDWPGLDPATLALTDGDAIPVINKIDLRPVGTARINGGPAVGISALTGEGIPELLRLLEADVAARYAPAEMPALTRARHRQAAEGCREHLVRALTAALPELMAEDVRLGARELGRITGRVDVEDLLDVIFRDFCIGK